MNVQVFRSLEEAHGKFGPASLAIGNFDGVHIGHQALLNAARTFATEHNVKPAVLTFHPHPTVLVAPSRVPPMLCTLERRIKRLQDAGAERILVLPFTEQLSALSPQQFVGQILESALQAKAVFVGESFRFGHKKAGSPEVLAELGLHHNIATTFLKHITFRGRVVSSSAIRQALAENHLALAARMLGRCFAVEGPVVSGQGIGSKQTVPTLNLLPAAGQLLLHGVYVTQTVDTDNGRVWPSITNAGKRPTFGGGDVTIETFLLGPLEGETPRNIRVEFRRYVRAERQFPSPEELKKQIMQDVGRARTYWRRVSGLS
jgi:riboflavin kinase/FMN adenylyltransferase